MRAVLHHMRLLVPACSSGCRAVAWQAASRRLPGHVFRGQDGYG